MMNAPIYDLIIVGGGIAGASLAISMARHGAQVLVLERTRQFRDRIRGEGMHSWGAAEARLLGLYDTLLETCAHEARYWATYRGSTLVRQRDLVETTPSRAAAVNFYHPDMQEALLGAASKAGAEVRRGAIVTEVAPGAQPSVTVAYDGTKDVVEARLVIGTDGSQSQVRRDGGFTVSRDPNHLMISGALFSQVGAPEDAVHIFVAPAYGHAALLFPIGGRRFRTYFTTGRRTEHRTLSGGESIDDFIKYCVDTGVPADWIAGSEMAGPLASFEGVDVWVDQPYKNGVALIGDAAAANDPCFGCGLSLTLRDVRVLRDSLLATEDWDVAAHKYAAEHDRYYGALHSITSWLREVRYGFGPEADQIREHALPKLADGSGPNLVGAGPDSPADEAARIRFLGC